MLRAVDVTLVKVNNQYSVDWITSLDYNNNSDPYAQILEYGPYLYLSLFSGTTNIYYWLAEIYLDSGAVVRSKWFKTFTNILIKSLVFEVKIVSEDYLFIQFSQKILNLMHNFIKISIFLILVNIKN